MSLVRMTAGAAATVLVAVGLTASSATAALTEHDVRPKHLTTGDTDFATSDTRSTGHRSFLEEGIRLWTEGDDTTDKVAEYFAVKRPLASVSDVELQWFGTSATPDVHYVVDFDADGSQDGVLVGEKGSGNDVWLTNQSKDVYKGIGAPSNSAGSGSANHGTLEQWSNKYPSATVLYGGFALGPSVKGDGVLRSISFGSHRYVFTNDDLPVEPPVLTSKAVTGAGAFKNVNRRAVFTMRSSVQPSNDTGTGKRLHWQIRVNGALRFSSYAGWHGATTWTWTFRKGTGKQDVTVLRNGKVYDQATILTR